MATLPAGEDTSLAQPFADMAPGRSDLVMVEGRPRLMGTICDGCGARSFLARQACYDCGEAALSPLPLAAAGRLYSFSTIHVSSSRPTPYTVGYVDLDDGVRVLGGILGGLLAIDAPVALVATEDGGWAFQVREA